MQNSFANESIKNFCEVLDANASLYTLIHYTPNLVTTYSQGPDSDIANVTTAAGTRSRFRIGAEFDLVNFLRVPIQKQLSAVRCQNRIAETNWKDYQSGGNLKEKLASTRILSKGVEAGLAVLEEGLGRLLTAELNYKKKVVNGLTTITDLSSVSDSIYSIRTQILDKKLELDKLKNDENELTSIYESVEGKEAREIGSTKANVPPPSLTEEVSLRRKESILDALNFNIIGGYQSISDSSYSNSIGGTYVGVQLKINLGATVSPLVQKDHEFRTVSSVDSIKKEAFAEQSRIQYLKSRKLFLEERLVNMKRMLQITHFNETNLESSPLAVKLYSNQLIAKAGLESTILELSFLTHNTTRKK